jgi:hypothetical protein
MSNFRRRYTFASHSPGSNVFGSSPELIISDQDQINHGPVEIEAILAAFIGLSLTKLALAYTEMMTVPLLE